MQRFEIEVGQEPISVSGRFSVQMLSQDHDVVLEATMFPEIPNSWATILVGDCPQVVYQTVTPESVNDAPAPSGEVNEVASPSQEPEATSAKTVATAPSAEPVSEQAAEPVSEPVVSEPVSEPVVTEQVTGQAAEVQSAPAPLVIPEPGPVWPVDDVAIAASQPVVLTPPRVNKFGVVEVCGLVRLTGPSGAIGKVVLFQA